jgi:hypothetical protein
MGEVSYKVEDFMSILMSNNEERIKDYLLHNGKKPKPISPIFYIKKGDKEDGNDQ